MEELIFFAVIIVMSILESIARSRKAKRQREGGEAPAEPEQFEWAQRPPWEAEPGPEQEPERPPVRSYDEDPSYDDRITRQEGVARERVEGTPEAVSSETAADIWAEISGLAAGRVPQSPSRAPLPKYAPPRPAPSPRPRIQRPTETRVEVPAKRPSRVEEHEVHLAHLGYGTDPSERPPSAQDVRFYRGEAGNPDAAWARRQVHGSPGSVRRAIILREILGPPVSERGGSARDPMGPPES